jgi:hypothetical protein
MENSQGFNDPNPLEEAEAVSSNRAVAAEYSGESADRQLIEKN